MATKKLKRLNYRVLGAKQQSFHDSTEPITIAIGGVGSGKSHMMMAELLSQLIENPQGRGRAALVVARTHDHAKKQILKICKDILTTAKTPGGKPCGFVEGVDFKVNLQSPITVSLPFGSTITIWSVEGGKSIKGQNVSYVAIDEVTDMDMEFFDDACDRAGREVVAQSEPMQFYPGRIWAAGNPKNKGNWLYKRFFEAFEANGDQNIPGSGVSCLYIGTFDNPLSESKRAMYEASAYSPLERMRRLEGRFVSLEGLCLPSFNAERHVFDRKTITIDPHWRHYMGLDFGERDATACLRIAKDEEDRYWVYAEYYHSGKTIRQHCDYIKRENFPGERIIRIYSDTHLETVSTYRENGVTNLEPVKKGPGSVLAGIAILNELFQDNRIYISRDCVNLLREIESYEWRSTTLREEPKPGYGDHAIDALRYCVTSLAQRAKLAALGSKTFVKSTAPVDPRPVLFYEADGKPVYGE